MKDHIKPEKPTEVGEKIGEHLMGLVAGGNGRSASIDIKVDLKDPWYVKSTWKMSF